MFCRECQGGSLVLTAGRDAGTGWCSGGFWVGNRPEKGVLQIQQEGWLFSLSRVPVARSIINVAQTFLRAEI